METDSLASDLQDFEAQYLQTKKVFHYLVNNTPTSSDVGIPGLDRSEPEEKKVIFDAKIRLHFPADGILLGETIPEQIQSVKAAIASKTGLEMAASEVEVGMEMIEQVKERLFGKLGGPKFDQERIAGVLQKMFDEEVGAAWVEELHLYMAKQNPVPKKY